MQNLDIITETICKELNVNVNDVVNRKTGRRENEVVARALCMYIATKELELFKPYAHSYRANKSDIQVLADYYHISTSLVYNYISIATSKLLDTKFSKETYNKLIESVKEALLNPEPIYLFEIALSELIYKYGITAGDIKESTVLANYICNTLNVLDKTLQQTNQ